MPVISFATSFNELLPLNELLWIALCPKGLTSATASGFFGFLWLLVQFVGGQWAEGIGGQAGCLFSLSASGCVAVSLVHSSCRPPLQLSPALGTRHTVSSPLFLNPRHSNHSPLHLVSGDVTIPMLFPSPSSHLYNVSLS